MTGPANEAGQEFGQQAPDGGAEALRRFREFGDDYLGITRELWRLIESQSTAAPGGSPALQEGLARLHDALKEKFERMYVPVMNPLHAQQQSTERLMTTSLRWQRASTRMSQLFSVAATAAVGNLAAALAGPPAAGPPVTSLRQLHELWVECGERAYAAAAHSEEFAAAQAELLSAMVELRFEQQRVIEEWARVWNLPSRSEIDALHRQLRELSRLLHEAREK
jgi:class III poly(R)-hydroxyalkanoic acid synthase PhaE subunit